MEKQGITIQVTPEAARIYRTASEQDRRKLDLLLSLRLTEAAQPRRSLSDLIREASEEARAAGLTEQMLEEILDGR